MKVYSFDSQLLAAGAQPYQVATHGWWFAKNTAGEYITTEVNPEIMGFHVRAFGASPGPLLIDIEAWDFETDHAIVAAQLPIAVRFWRDGSDRELGFYAHMPERDWFTPVHWWAEVTSGVIGNARLEMLQWQERNTRNAAEFMPLFDFICPSIYAFYPQQLSAWRIYAQCNIDEAVRTSGGKPVRPILYPILPDGSYIDAAEWEGMVKWTASHPGVESVLIFAPHEDPWRNAVKSVIGAA